MRHITYEIMHLDRVAAIFCTNGFSDPVAPDFMPYNLYLESGSDVDTLVNNITNFQYWCATRVITLDRTYAKEILNSIGVKQAVTDRDRAAIALSYRCVSLTDVYWVRIQGEHISFADVNLYDNHLSNIFIDISLRGKQFTADNKDLAHDLSTNGQFPKAWRRTANGFTLLKDGGRDAVEREVLASQISRCFPVPQVLYSKTFFEGEPVSSSELMTSKAYSIASIEAFEIYSANRDLSTLDFILNLDACGYYMMNIIDYLVGNTDRHWGNWGVLVDNNTNRPIRLHDLMDFNRAFHAYDTMDGANCQTTFGRKYTQKEAAIDAVRSIGFQPEKAFDAALFSELPQYYEMFSQRVKLLQSVQASGSQK
ncbi:MAG: hypothetical protein Q4B26_14910 [Eubacteriales bacterium]|nr:hypothetical protein [Eubacteriales bacterium]